jgi:hypothetical protein
LVLFTLAEAAVEQLVVLAVLAEMAEAAVETGSVTATQVHLEQTV